MDDDQTRAFDFVAHSGTSSAATTLTRSVKPIFTAALYLGATVGFLTRPPSERGRLLLAGLIWSYRSRNLSSLLPALLSQPRSSTR